MAQTPLNYTTTTGATRTPSNLTSDDYLNIARLAGLTPQQEQFSGNRATQMQRAQKFAELGKQGFTDWSIQQAQKSGFDAGSFGQGAIEKYGSSDPNVVMRKMAEESANKFEQAFAQHLGGANPPTPNLPTNQTMQGDTITPTPTTQALQGLPEIQTGQPSPQTVSATPFTQPAQPQTAQQTQQQTAEQMKQAFQAVQGQPVPTTAGQARTAITAATPPPQAPAPVQPTRPSISPVEIQIQQDPGYQQMLASRQEYVNVVNQSRSLMDSYNQLMKDAGIPQINETLLNTQKVIDGTEDDIRAEVQAAQGFATESQVLALASSRNKQLIKNYNQLLATKQMAQEQVNNMMQFAVEDRNFALNSIMQKMQIDQQIIQYRDKFVQNAREGYQNIINQVGYGGFLEMLGNDPTAINLAERTLGLGQGQLQNIAGFIGRQTRLAGFQDYTITSPYVLTTGGEVQNAQTGEAYTSPEDFAQKTGMTLDQANQRGLIKPLGLTVKEQQQQFENVLKLEDLAMDKEKLAMERQRLGLEATRVGIARQEQALKQQEFLQKLQTTAPGTPSPVEIAKQQDSIVAVDSLKTRPGLDNAVGPNWFARGKSLSWDNLSGETQGFIAEVEKLRSNLNLDTLVNAKKQGATFGALSDQELKILGSAGTKLGTWAITKDGNVVGYNVSEKEFKKELDRINNYAKLDFVLKGGAPEQVGITVTPDGKYWSRNSDGTLTNLR